MTQLTLNPARICEQFRKARPLCSKAFELLETDPGTTVKEQQFPILPPEIETQYRNMQKSRRGKWNVITKRTADGVDIDYDSFPGSAGMNIEIFTLSTGRSTVTSSICFRAPRDEMYVRPFEFLFLKIAGLIKINRTVSDIVIDLESRQVPILCVTPQGEKKWALSNRLESRIKAETLTGYRATPDMNVFEAAFGTAVYRVFYDILSHFPADKVGAMQHLAHNLIRELITEFQTMFDSAIRHFEKSQIPSRPV